MARRRHELTDEQWDRIKPLLPGKEGDPGRTAADNRTFVDAVLYVLKTGIPWRDLPERFGSWNSVWRRFDRWCKRGIWQQVFEALAEPELEEELAELQLDSSSIKAHPVATTWPRLPAEKKRAEKKRLTSAAASAAAAED